MTLDDKTFEKSLMAVAINLKQAYQVTRRLNDGDAKKAVGEFWESSVMKDILGLNPSAALEDVRNTFVEVLDKLLEEYKDKQDKSYTALLRLKEVFR